MERLRVLLVEDERDLREMMGDALEDLGMDIEVAQDGHQALALLEGTPFNVVVSDISMPRGISGIDLAHQVHARMPGSRIILVSGHARAQLPEIPAYSEFLGKPYRLRQLVDLLTKRQDLTEQNGVGH